MSFHRVKKSISQNTQTSPPSRLTPRPFTIQPTQQPPTPEETENQTFQQNKFEAIGLQLKEKSGTITPVEQANLGMLQAKMDSFWAQRMEKTKSQPNLLAILTQTTPAQPVQPKLTVGQPHDPSEQEAEQVAEEVTSLAPKVPQTAGVQKQTSKNIQPAPSLVQRAPTDTPTKDAPTAHPTLCQGATGASVMDLQQKLNTQGATPPLKVDGIFGPLTHAAVLNFQKTHPDSTGKPLVVDGVVGKLTWGALDQVSKPKVEPLAANELILSSDPKDTNEASVAQFRLQVSSKVVSWGLSFSPTDVQLKTILLGTDEKSAVILKWEAAWGTKPVSTEIPSSMTPIDAKAAVTGVHQLAGWSKVASSDQGILNGMLGGETNALSETSRNYLRPLFPTLATKTDVEQANTLNGLITNKDAVPSVVDEPVTTTKMEYTLTGPTERKDYAFRGKTADAEEWIVEFKDGIKISIISPKAPEAGYHNHTVQQAADAASYLPKANRSVVNTILLNAVVNPDDPYWAGEYKQPDFHSYMTAGAAGIVTIYPDKATKSLPGENYMRGTMIHETGHTWSYKTWGSDETKGKWLEWKQSMDADKVSVSGYATASIAEDVAETIQIYVSTQGSPRFEEYRQIVPHRFAMLDKEYKP